MHTRKDVVSTCLAMGGVYADQPFHDDNWTLIRHEKNHKAFAMIFERDGNIWINVKATPEACVIWREIYPAVCPAYHMNKRNWVSIILDGSMSDKEILPLLRDSYALAAPKKREKA